MFEAIAAEAVDAVRKRLREMGLRDFEVVVNVAWPTQDGGEVAFGSVVPDRLPMLADSLRQSAEEAAPADAVDPARVDHDAAEFVALAGAFEGALHRFVATPEGHCPNYGEASESCDCLTCRTQTLLGEWEDTWWAPTEEERR